MTKAELMQRAREFFAPLREDAMIRIEMAEHSRGDKSKTVYEILRRDTNARFDKWERDYAALLADVQREAELKEAELILGCYEEEFTDHFEAWLKQHIAQYRAVKSAAIRGLKRRQP